MSKMHEGSRPAVTADGHLPGQACACDGCGKTGRTASILDPAPVGWWWIPVSVADPPLSAKDIDPRDVGNDDVCCLLACSLGCTERVPWRQFKGRRKR